MKRQPLKRKSRLSPVSKKRSAALKQYAASRKAFLALRPLCEVWVELTNEGTREASLLKAQIFGGIALRPEYSTDIHHVEGRIGEKLLDENTWMACSRKAHDWIHSHASAARKMGWLK